MLGLSAWMHPSLRGVPSVPLPASPYSKFPLSLEKAAPRYRHPPDTTHPPFSELAWRRKLTNIYFLYIKRKGGPPFVECGNMGVFDRGVQMLLTTVGAFAAFSLMTIAVGTDYWLYSRGVCKIKSTNENETSKKNEEVMTHSGLWRTCCLEGYIFTLLTVFGVKSYRVRASWIHSVCLSSWTDGPVSVVQLWRLTPEIQPVADFHDGSCPGTTGAALGAPALTGGAQQALNAAINLHHGGFESKRGEKNEGFYSRYFLTPKKTGRLRPILHLSQFNRYITERPFHMLTVRHLMSPGSVIKFSISEDQQVYGATVTEHRLVDEEEMKLNLRR
ncbi:hypothetical protein FQN60_012471, partial [Etheostoma spectabile]